eukprot:jgi/Chlat1/6005/Chrsp4S06313
MATSLAAAAAAAVSSSSSCSYQTVGAPAACARGQRARPSSSSKPSRRPSASPALRHGERAGLVAAAASGDSARQQTKSQTKTELASPSSTLSPVSLESIAADPSAGSVAVSSDFAAASVVRRYYDAFNVRDVDAAVACFAEDVVYEDLVYGKAFRSAKDVRDYLADVKNIVPDGLQFVVDDITDGGGKVGAIWHVEINGKPFFFSRGCSFYRVDVHSQKITYARDIPEPVSKPGRVALVMLRLISELTKKFPGLLDFVDKDAVLPPFKK